MEPLSDKELLELASCPPSSAANNPYLLIESAEERISLHKDIIDGLVATIANECCEQMTAIATALTSIERHLKRLVNKELKGTGQALMEIAGYLKTIALSQVGETELALTLIQQQLLFGPPAPPVDAFAEAPETTPAGSTGEGSFTGQGEITVPQPEPEVIEPPSIVPSVTEAPSFVPEQSAAVGGETFAAPVPVSSLDKPLVGPLNPDFINPEEVIV